VQFILQKKQLAHFQDITCW